MSVTFLQTAEPKKEAEVHFVLSKLNHSGLKMHLKALTYLIVCLFSGTTLCGSCKSLQPYKINANTAAGGSQRWHYIPVPDRAFNNSLH